MTNKKKITQSLQKIKEINAHFQNTNLKNKLLDKRLNFITQKLKEELEKKTPNIAKSQMDKWLKEISTVHKLLFVIDNKISVIYRQMLRERTRQRTDKLELSQQRFKESIELIRATPKWEEESKQKHLELLQGLSDDIEDLQKSKQKLPPRELDLLFKASNHTRNMYFQLNGLGQGTIQPPIFIQPEKELYQIGFEDFVIDDIQQGQAQIYWQSQALDSWWSSLACLFRDKFRLNVQGIPNGWQLTVDTMPCNQQSNPIPIRNGRSRYDFDKNPTWHWCLYNANAQLQRNGHFRYAESGEDCEVPLHI